MLSIIAFGLALTANPIEPVAAAEPQSKTAAAMQPYTADGIQKAGFVNTGNPANVLENALQADAFKAVQARSQPLAGKLSVAADQNGSSDNALLSFNRLKIGLFDQRSGFVRAAFKSNDPDPANLKQLGMEGMDVYKTWMVALTFSACEQAPTMADSTAVRWDGFTKMPAQFLGRMYLTCGESRRLQSTLGTQISRSARVAVDRGERIDDLAVQLVDFQDNAARLAWLAELKRMRLLAVGSMKPGTSLSH